MYIKGHAEKTVQELSKIFGAVLVAGPRQVGKTTMLERLTSDSRSLRNTPFVVRQTQNCQNWNRQYQENPYDGCHKDSPLKIQSLTDAAPLFNRYLHVFFPRSRSSAGAFRVRHSECCSCSAHSRGEP